MRKIITGKEIADNVSDKISEQLEKKLAEFVETVTVIDGGVVVFEGRKTDTKLPVISIATTSSLQLVLSARKMLKEESKQKRVQIGFRHQPLSR